MGAELVDELDVGAFWARVALTSDDEDDRCWLWQGAVDRYGYGRVRARGRELGAHRVAYMLERGEIPAGLIVLHSSKCTRRGVEGRRCCRPTHLRLGTAQTNAEQRSRDHERRSGRGRAIPDGVFE